MPGVLVDAGPLVAVLDRSDRHHGRCVEQLRSLAPPLLTVWPVVIEAMSLLGASWRAQDALWEMLIGGTVQIRPLDATDLPRMRALMHRYRLLPMDLADAALVHVAERDGIRTVFTIDRRDFSTYRLKSREKLTLLPA